MPKLFPAWVEGGGENITLVYRDYTQQLYHKQLNQSRSEVNPVIRKILHVKSGFKINSQLLAWICRLFLSRLIFSQLSINTFFTFRDLFVCTATLITLPKFAKNQLPRMWPKFFWIEVSLSFLRKLENIKWFWKDFAHNTCFELPK